MNLLFALFCLMVQSHNAQIVSLTLCSDDSCVSNCVSSTVNVGDCFPYTGLLSSRSMSGSVAKIDALTFYSDAQCKNAVPSATDMLVFMDSGCKSLYGANDSKLGSYKASNLSAIIGGVVGGCSFVVGSCFLIYFLHKQHKLNRIAQLVAPTVVDDIDNSKPVFIPKRTNLRLSLNPFYSAGNNHATTCDSDKRSCNFDGL